MFETGIQISIIIIAYLVGSIPFGLLIAKLGGQGDIRKTGSGNIGATNVLRTGRKDLALLTLLSDAAKAALAVRIAGYFFGNPAGLIAGAAALTGHCYPVWLKFRGGKGVATYFGFLFAVSGLLGLVVSMIWLVTALASRISSLAALTAAALAPAIAYAVSDRTVAGISALLTLLIYWRHRENIHRILAGNESRIGKRK